MNAVSIEVATARDANPSGVMFGGWLMRRVVKPHVRGQT